ncbi:hypothetical protein TNIN_441071 [Trichonephila inaurata madagascariensis]|uniref:Uncharacterized protein n=1 Tax=Trichonephila inaurata madagascariensis TaxID=2747483 RepID=A0A8X7BU59_9ARAC|nr:hypothetical protein TNIN_441071 [Trichonephila inaurata madagascariensis]
MDATGVREVSGIEKRTVHRILRNELLLRKIAARWVPHALTEVQRYLLYAICSMLRPLYSLTIGRRSILVTNNRHRLILGHGIRNRTETSVRGMATCWITKEA